MRISIIILSILLVACSSKSDKEKALALPQAEALEIGQKDPCSNGACTGMVEVPEYWLSNLLSNNQTTRREIKVGMKKTVAIRRIDFKSAGTGTLSDCEVEYLESQTIYNLQSYSVSNFVNLFGARSITDNAFCQLNMNMNYARTIREQTNIGTLSNKDRFPQYPYHVNMIRKFYVLNYLGRTAYRIELSGDLGYFSGRHVQGNVLKMGFIEESNFLSELYYYRNISELTSNAPVSKIEIISLSSERNVDVGDIQNPPPTPTPIYSW